MTIQNAIRQIVEAPRDPFRPAPSNQSIRGLAKQILRDLLKTIRLRQQADGFGELTSGEERLARFVVQTYTAAVEEFAAETAPPPISLSELSPDALRQLIAPESATQ